jgi:DivIVA domain-containing protein
VAEAAHDRSVSLDMLTFVASSFMVALRGYDMAQVDQLLAQADEALSSGSETLRASARDALRNTRFRERLRGYARHEVEHAVEQRLRQLG